MIYDLSPPITADLAVWPGDTPPSREILMDMRRGDHLTLSTLHATVHLGTHVDAANHYGATAPGVEAWPVDRFLGRCQVVRTAIGPGERVSPDAMPVVEAPRVLVATGTYPDPTVFREDFAALSPDLIDWLADQAVQLVGIDTPSVDPFDSKTLDTHQACLRRDVAILEGLVLRDVPAGVYELIAVPLRLVGFDASPVRALLRVVG